MKALVFALFVPLLAIGSSSAQAFDVKDPGLERKVCASEFVAIAQAIEVESSEDGSNPFLAALSISQVLAGEHGGSIFFLRLDEGGPEFNPRCCEVGRTYLVFAEAGFAPHFRSAGGPHGVFEVRDGMVLDWGGPSVHVAQEDVEAEISLVSREAKNNQSK